MEREMNDYKIDSHKLNLHPGRVADWLGGKTFYPVYMEVSPSGACNHRCVFCSLDFMEYRKRFLDASFARGRLPEMARLGIRAIQYAGEGEPLLHGDIAGIVRHTGDVGIDVGISTNGVLLDVPLVENLLPYCAWIKISVDAGKRETHARVHGCREADFDRVMANVRRAVEVRDDNKYGCVLGIQMVVLPENVSEMHLLAERARDMGVDYVVFKPYAHNPCSRHDSLYTPFNVWDTVESLQTRDFKVVVRENAIRRDVGKGRSFNRCLALSFWCYLDSGGDVWGCYRYLGNDRFHYGNIYQNSFERVWNDSRQKRNGLTEKFDISECGINCRMEEINRYLWRLKHPEAHDSFI